MGKDFQGTSGFEELPLMDPEVFNRSKVADQVIQDTFKNIDIVLMSFDMSKKYTKEFYRLLGVGSVFHGLPFSVTDTTPVQFSFKKRNKHDTSVELTGDNGKNYIFFENSLKPNAQIHLIDKDTHELAIFIYNHK